MSNKLNLIYALIDPRTDEVRYIGKSTQGIKRAYDHKKPSELKYKTHKTNWIKSLIDLGLMYNVVTLEYCETKEETSVREQYWIKLSRNHGAKLTNSTDGGEGTLGRVYSPETIQKLSTARIQFHKNNPEVQHAITEKQIKKHRDNNGIIEKHCSDCNEYKQLDMFSTSRGNWDGLKHICKSCNNLRTEEYRKNTFVKLTDEEIKQSYIDRKEAMRQGVINNYNNNPETKAKLSKALSKAVIGTCVLTGKQIEFVSALEAKNAGFQNSNLGEAIRKNKAYKGYTWKFKV